MSTWKQLDAGSFAWQEASEKPGEFQSERLCAWASAEAGRKHAGEPAGSRRVGWFVVVRGQPQHEAVAEIDRARWRACGRLEVGLPALPLLRIALMASGLGAGGVQVPTVGTAGAVERACASHTRIPLRNPAVQGGEEKRLPPTSGNSSCCGAAFR
jgi:hypothetical protein